MSEVKDKHAHKSLLALAIGGPSGSQTWIVSLLELSTASSVVATSCADYRLSRSSIAEPIGDAQEAVAPLSFASRRGPQKGDQRTDTNPSPFHPAPRCGALR